MSRYTSAPLPHHAAAERSRLYADRAQRATHKRSITTGGPRPWIDLYLSRYRYLTGRTRTAGPRPVWLPARAPKTTP